MVSVLGCLMVSAVAGEPTFENVSLETLLFESCIMVFVLGLFMVSVVAGNMC